jgi:hypothetical protein
LHMKPRHTAEQSTVDVNKAKKIGKIGFGAVLQKKVDASEPRSFSMPLQTTLSPFSEVPETVAVAAEPTLSPFNPLETEDDQVYAKVDKIIHESSSESEIESGLFHQDLPSMQVLKAPGPSLGLMGKGFASLDVLRTAQEITTPKPVSTTAPVQQGTLKIHAPSDPQDELICDSCQ